MSHDDGGDRDGGSSASESNVKGKHHAVSNVPFAGEREAAENDPMRPGAVCAVVILCVGVVWLAHGQNQDRDSRGVPKTSSSAPAPGQRVDINHASVDELLKVPGLTRGWAVRIVRFRPYRSKQDLFEKGVLSSEIYDRIKDFVIAHHEKQ
jgi:DNA uptake protein ComE-like DNA-binding protein